MNYKEVIDIWTADNPLPAADFLITHGIIKNSIPGPKCDLGMKLIRVSFELKPDGYAYTCKNKVCNQIMVLSCRNSSPFLKKFEKTKLQDLVHLMFLWAIDECNKNAHTKS